MAGKAARRSQHERREATIEALTDAARALFARAGFAATTLDDVVAAAGVTKGALYHHFDSKHALFAAVFAREQAQLASEIVTAAAAERDPWAAFARGCRAFLDWCMDPARQRIFLLDAPGALGWEEMRRLEAGSLAMLELGLRRAMDAGRLRARPPGPLAHMLFGALCEAAMVVARAPDPTAAHADMAAELKRILAGLAER